MKAQLCHWLRVKKAQLPWTVNCNTDVYLHDTLTMRTAQIQAHAEKQNLVSTQHS